jgi:thiosulfate/3-mercaptopyruvate sulfurtransferase
MRTKKIAPVLLLFTVLITAAGFQMKPGDEPWTPEQLLAPEQLAAVISDPNAVKPIILNIGPAGHIKGSVKIGATREKENLSEMKKLLAKEPKNREIVLYCIVDVVLSTYAQTSGQLFPC